MRHGTSDEAHSTPHAAGLGDEQTEHLDCHAASFADQASLTIEGESYATAYLERLQAGTTRPDELAAIAGFLRGDMLSGFCRLLQKALERAGGINA